MQTNKEMEPEIRLRDCLFHLLYHWRSLIAAALIGALVFGGYAYWQNQNRKSSKTETAAVQEASQTETNYGNSNAIYSQLLEGSDAWRKESVLMQVDPYRVWESIAVFGVAPEEGQGADLAVAIAQAYPAGILSAVDEAQVRQIYGEAGAREVADLLSGEADSETGVSFTMKAIGTTKEMAEEGMACLKAAMETFSRGSAQQLGAHRVVPLSESTTQRADSAVEARQAAIAKNIATYQSAILSNEKNTTSASSSSSSSGKVSKKSLTKYAVIGGGAGLLGMAVVWLLIYMLSGTIKESEILTRQFGLPLYGTLRHSRARKPGKGLDGLIEKWEFRNLPAANETVYDNICSLIPAGISGEILLTGTGRAEKMKPLYDALTARIQAPVSLKMEADLIHNSAAVIAAREASAVLVAEELYVSKEKEISREADILTLCGTPVLGAVAY